MSPLLNTRISPTGVIIHIPQPGERARMLEALTGPTYQDLTDDLKLKAAASKASRDAHLNAPYEGTTK